MIIGQDGGIYNFLEDIENVVLASNGVVVELGVALGTGSTIAILSGLYDKDNPLHISVDQTDRMVLKPTVPWWYLVVGDDREESTLNRVSMLLRGRHPGVIYIDTDHDYEQMSAELPLWSVLADGNTVFLFHDTHMFGVPNEGMNSAIREFAARAGWVFDDWRTEPHGLGRMFKKK